MNIEKTHEQPTRTTSPISGESAINSQMFWNAGLGYEQLGLLDEAETEYGTIPKGDCYFLSARVRLAFIYMLRGNIVRAVEMGRALTEGIFPSPYGINLQANLLSKAGQASEAYALALAHPAAFDNGSGDMYAKACYATQVGEMAEAAEALMLSYRADDQYWLKSLFDSDLEPFWKWGSCAYLELKTATFLANPLFTAAVEKASSHRGELPLDYVMLTQVPSEISDFIQADLETGFYWLARKTPADLKRRYLDWQDAYKIRMIKYARVAISRAKERTEQLKK